MDEKIPVLSRISAVVKTAKAIHKAAGDARSFQAQSRTLAKNVAVIVQLVEVLEKRCTKEGMERYRDIRGDGSSDAPHAANLDENGVRIWISSLSELQCCMEEIQSFLKKLSNRIFFQKLWQKRKICDKFEDFTNTLLIIGQSLNVSLQVEFTEYFNEEMKSQLNDSFSANKIIANKVEDLKKDLQNQAKDVPDTKAMVSECHFLQQLSTPSENEGHIAFADLIILEKLHDGKYGPILKAKHILEDKMLVLKAFEDNGPSARKELKEQCELWKKLEFSRFIVHLYGYTMDDGGRMCFVLEYMPLGTLRSVLLDVDHHPLSWEQRLTLAKDCAQGLCAIHHGQGKTMLHGAVTSTRFMVDENYRAKISDNGFVTPLSKICTSLAAIKSEGRGSLEQDEVNYLCPEETTTSFKRTTKSEVYKLGVVFYEIASRKKPFQAMEERGGKALANLDKLKFINEGKTEQPPGDTPEDFKALIDRCRQTKPSDRPSTYDVVSCLEKMCFEFEATDCGASYESDTEPSEIVGEPSQRVIRLEKYQIEVQVPPSEPWGVEDITVRAITEVPPQLLDVLQENEALICVGLEMTPSDAKFSTPIKVTMPHSAIFKDPDQASVGMHYRKSGADSLSRISFDGGSPPCVVRERDLDLFIDHFSEWWITAFITRIFIGKRVICTPSVPISPPRNAEHLLHMCIRDRGTELQLEAGYTAPIRGEEYFIAWYSGDLKITCNADNKEVDIKKRAKSLFKHSTKINVPFVVDTEGTEKHKIFVQFILEQSATIDVICPLTFSDSHRQTSGEMATLDSHRQSSGEMAIAAAASPDLSASSSSSHDPVTDDMLENLSSHVPHEEYTSFCGKLGIGFNEATTYLDTVNKSYKKAVRHFLNKWKNKTSRSIADLEVILCAAELGDLKKHLK